jgi:hypothetical protein
MMMIAQLDLIQQQATMDKMQIREELFGLKNRIKWLEQQVGPTDPVEETLSTPTSIQRQESVPPTAATRHQQHHDSQSPPSPQSTKCLGDMEQIQTRTTISDISLCE